MTQAHVTPANKAELLDDMKSRWNTYVTTVDSLPHEQWTTPTDAAGWTACDHVAHVTAWDQALVGLLEDRTPQQRTLQVSDAAWTSGTDSINDEIRRRTMGQSVATVKTERDATFVALLDAVTKVADDDLERPAGEFGLDEGQQSLREVLVDYIGGHYDEHRQYIATLVEG